MVRTEKLEAWRLIDGDGDGMEGLSVDHYFGRYLLTAERESWFELRPSLEAAIATLHREISPELEAKFHWVANLPGTRGPQFETAADSFEVGEDGARFEVHLGEGPHSGLFLDQRENRREVRKISSERRVLNLFCHTGAFTVAALRGGAREVVSVDLSKNYLAWLERNLRLNGLAKKSAPNFAMDAFAYLEKARRQGERFGLILLDPPTFGRGKGKAFSTERDYGILLEACLELLEPKGRLLACLNTRKMGVKEFRDLLKEGVKSRGRKILQPGGRPADFPGGGSDGAPLKAFWVV